MTRRRVLTLVPVLAAVSAALFAAAAVSPFDPLVGYLGARYESTSAADRALLTDQLGLDAPWYQLYWHWAADLLTGNLGFSRSFGQPVSELLAQRLPWTALLVVVGMSAAVAVALGVGVWAGMHRGGTVDRLVAATCVALQGLPPFVVSLGAIALFAVGLGWLPPAGLTDAGADAEFGQVARHLVLPAAALAVSQLPWLLLAVRESVSDRRGEDFVVGAATRGIDTSTITRRHILPTSLAPFVTILGVRLPEVVVGAVLVEEIFSWPGVAGAFVQSAKDLDMALLAVLTIGTTCAVMLGSLLADIAVVVLDPRVRADG
ncbi:ABC transporter permease [Nocardia neocaledoniensis]|uniref:Peptide/nickel transport system permease protein n=1 Tax=Nocardia neocaledoniensis TaxID=236511 RepID=A0A317NV88_9NOCA|nr:ABC transporter permease [Nocardia neocaledoniensis]PWV79306.1 peptide/nickel transport system permease protein [Nocardia neocaledoniensis]